MKDTDIYPKYEFRLSHEDKEWLQKEIEELKLKFNDSNHPVVTKNVLIMTALKYGFKYLKLNKKFSELA